MKKKLHLRKTKPHWKRKPERVVTRREKEEARRAAEAALRHRFRHSPLTGPALSLAALDALFGGRR